MPLLLAYTCGDALERGISQACDGAGWSVRFAEMDERNGTAGGEADAALFDVRGSKGWRAKEVAVKHDVLFPVIFLVDELPEAAENSPAFRYYVTADRLEDLEHVLICLTCAGISDEHGFSSGDTSRRPRILIVDDDPEIASLMARLFRAAGKLDVQVAHSGAQAAAILPAFRPDVAVIDVLLGDTDGRDVCTWIHGHAGLENARVVGISGFYLGEEDRQDGFDAFLQKPFRMNDILETVKRLLPSEPDSRAGGRAGAGASASYAAATDEEEAGLDKFRTPAHAS